MKSIDSVLKDFNRVVSDLEKLEKKNTVKIESNIGFVTKLVDVYNGVVDYLVKLIDVAKEDVNRKNTALKSDIEKANRIRNKVIDIIS